MRKRKNKEMDSIAIGNYQVLGSSEEENQGEIHKG
jgi:hypothetical protein